MRFFVTCLLCTPLTFFVASAQAQTGLLDKPKARFFSHEGNLAFLALGTLAASPRDSARALVTSTAVATGLKYLTKEQRPDQTTHDSFPSGHATAAFTVGGLAAAQRPHGLRPALWLLGAGLIADSRVVLKRHWARDVIVGALLGLAVARSPSARLRF
jgi:membrane-associated phospholipid phosphatase